MLTTPREGHLSTSFPPAEIQQQIRQLPSCGQTWTASQKSIFPPIRRIGARYLVHTNSSTNRTGLGAGTTGSISIAMVAEGVEVGSIAALHVLRSEAGSREGRRNEKMLRAGYAGGRCDASWRKL